MNNPLSYRFIQDSIKNFRSFRRDDFNLYDEPGTYWFKPIFYFYRSIDGDGINNEGLLHPSWESTEHGDGNISNNPQGTKGEQERKDILNQDFVSSAYNYLIRNDEVKRANLLKQFINLLSNISSRSPWYFQEVSGLDNAMDRSAAYADGVFVSDERKQITFTLLSDAVDDRIGTLLDLYQASCFSWKEKKEIVPANLRKFDMGLYIHGSMIQDNNKYESKQEFVNGAGKTEYTQDYSSTKGQSHLYLEFTNCEISLSSSKGGDSVSNAEGSERKYTLVISYDDCFINRYNDFIVGAIGDILRIDIDSSIYGKSIDTELGRKYNSIEKITGNLSSVTVGRAVRELTTTVNKHLLGNLYGFSLTNSVRDITSGRIINTTAGEIESQTKSSLKSIKNLSQSNIISSNLSNIEEPVRGNLYQSRPIPSSNRIGTLGNLYRGIGLLSNL